MFCMVKNYLNPLINFYEDLFEAIIYRNKYIYVSTATDFYKLILI